MVPINLITHDNYISGHVWDPPPVDEDRGLALELIANYVFPQEDPFTRGAAVVKKQKLIKGTIRDALDAYAAELCDIARCKGPTKGKISFNKAKILEYARKQYKNAKLACKDSQWMVQTLNEPLDFLTSDDYTEKVDGCEVCKVKFRNFNYTYIDRADMHAYRNGRFLFPDILIVLINYHNPFHWIGFVNQEYDIKISWNASASSEYQYLESHGLKWSPKSPRIGRPFEE